MTFLSYEPGYIDQLARFGVLFVGSAFIFAAIAVAFTVIMDRIQLQPTNIRQTIATMMFCLILGAFFVFVGSQTEVFYCKPRYEVLIDDNVTFKEFHSRYELIKQRGDIYTIELLEESEDTKDE